MPDSTIQVNNTFGKIVLKSHLSNSTLDGVESLKELHQLDSEMSQTSHVNSESSYSSNCDESIGALETPSAMSLFDTNSIIEPMLLSTSQLFDPTSTVNSRYDYSKPLSISRSAAAFNTKELYPSKWTSYDNVFESANQTAHTMQSPNLFENDLTTVRKYQSNYRNNDMYMGRSCPYTTSLSKFISQ